MSYRGVLNKHPSNESLGDNALEIRSFKVNQVKRLSMMQSSQSVSSLCCTCDVGTETDPTMMCCPPETHSRGSQTSNEPTCRGNRMQSVQTDLSMEAPKRERASRLGEQPEAQFSAESRKLPTTYFQRIGLSGEDMSDILEDLDVASDLLKTALEIRARYMTYSGQSFPKSIYKLLQPDRLDEDELSASARHPTISEANPWFIAFPPDTNYGIQAIDGVFCVYTDRSCIEALAYKYPDLQEYIGDMRTMSHMISAGPLKTFCFRRLCYLSLRLKMHVLLNELLELAVQKAVSHRDFYNIRKVDTNVHSTACMNQKHLLRFMKKTLQNKPGEIVMTSRNKRISLSQVFDSLSLTKYDLSVNKLDMNSSFDNCDSSDNYAFKYSPFDKSPLHEVFLETDNEIGGKFFADIIKEVALDLEDSKHQHAELRLSIFGKSYDEWPKLAHWAIEHNVYSSHIRWLVQTPRLYHVYKARGCISSFQDILDNIFKPVFEATNEPSKHPEMHRFLQHVVGFDSADDESRHDQAELHDNVCTPANWTEANNPSYCYYIYYMYANITVLNQFRKARGLNTFTLRPHCGAAGNVEHMTAGYIMAENITHGLQLNKVPVLQYLYYLTQIGIAMSPLSNNSAVLNNSTNPLQDFLARGLMVSLCTGEPLKFHFTKEPLMEEYSISAQLWKLSTIDMSELARNSVLMCGFPHKTKQKWLGDNYWQEGVAGNDIKRSNLPNVRVAYRNEVLMAELSTIFEAAD